MVSCQACGMVEWAWLVWRRVIFDSTNLNCKAGALEINDGIATGHGGSCTVRELRGVMRAGDRCFIRPGQAVLHCQVIPN